MSEARLRALLYARVSTVAQAGDDRTSLDSQLTACRELAGKQGWEVVGEFRDASSGDNLSRPGLDEVRQWAREGRFDLFVAHKQERISRNQTDTGVLYSEFRKAGARIWTVQEGTFEDTPLGQLILQLYAFAAAQDRANRAEATGRGRREKVKQGKIFGSSSKASYGYSFVYEEKPNGAMVKVAYAINEEEAAVVRGVYDAVLAGQSMKAIARSLNDRGISTPYGKDKRYGTCGQWRSQVVSNMVRNRQYSGEAWALVNKRKEKADGRHYGLVKTDLSNGFKLPDGVIPVIIDRATWERAQVILDQKPRPTRAPEAMDVWLRGGLAVCGLCGGNLIVKQRGDRVPFLRCTRERYEVGACGNPSPSIVLHKLQKPVWEILRSVVLDPYSLYDRYYSNDQQNRDESRLAELRQELAGVEQRRTRLIRSLEELDDADLAEIRARLAELASKRDDLRGQVDAMERRVEGRRGEQDRLLQLSSWLQAEAGRVDSLTPAEKRAVALELGLTVRLYPTTAPERYVVEIGARYSGEGFFAGVDWGAVGEPTPEEREATARIEAQERERGYGAEEIGRLMYS
jgi:site-specific DNA recombinase